MLSWIDAAVAELLLFAGVGLLIGGVDDLAVDLIWLIRGWRRARTVYAVHQRATMTTLAPPDRPGRIAILIGAWHEGKVIGRMLRRALATIDHDDYRIYVGTYCNDLATGAAVAAVAREDDRIRHVVSAVPGKTTKGENLNRIWSYLLADEQVSGIRYKAIVFHDAEDVIHPFELRLFDRMIEQADVVQIPVLPIADPRSPWIRGHYCDEFAESHHRQIIVRETLGAAVPLAGVGCAISRRAVGHIARIGGGRPFDAASLTEDYELGLRLRELGYRGIFMLLPESPDGPPVAVRAYFPDRIRDAVTQKRRWIAGIAMAGWDRLGWTGHPGEYWMRLRDRRVLLATAVLAAAYLALVGWGLSFFGHLAEGTAPPSLGPWLTAVCGINLLLLLWRGAMRYHSVRRFYGAAEAWRAPLRIIVSNAIAMMASARAVLLYLSHMSGRPLKWDKTDHDFPEDAP